MKRNCAVILACTLVTFSCMPALAAPLPGGASSLQETYQDWTVSCQNQQETSVCVMRQVQSNTQTGQHVLTVELHNVAGNVGGILLMPFGLDLVKGASLQIDEVPGPGVAFSTCVPQGCMAPVSFDVKQVAALRNGTNINVTATALSPSQPVAFKVSLKGFGAALDRITTLTK